MSALSNRELQVLDLVMAGDASKVIARKLGITPRTVDSHRRHIREKLGIRGGLANLAMAVITRGLLLAAQQNRGVR